MDRNSTDNTIKIAEEYSVQIIYQKGERKTGTINTLFNILFRTQLNEDCQNVYASNQFHEANESQVSRIRGKNRDSCKRKTT
ncbi:MAG: hypothetical protein ACFE9R_14710 [Candidatus Hermodarchaeota archaeon]